MAAISKIDMTSRLHRGWSELDKSWYRPTQNHMLLTIEWSWDEWRVNEEAVVTLTKMQLAGYLGQKILEHVSVERRLLLLCLEYSARQPT